jgi:PAS domain S-box-containing protein
MATQRILVVADERLVAGELETRLTEFGYEVELVTSGREAVAVAEQKPPHLVLMDVELAGDMDGIRSAEMIRERASTPIIYMVADTDVASLRRVRAIQPFGYVVKPFMERELRSSIDMALHSDRAMLPANELEERFFDVSLDLLCCLDFNGHFKRLSPSWERTLGFTREELMSRPFIEFVHSEDRERTLTQNREVRAGGQALAFENRYLCRDGSFRWLRWNATTDSSERVIYSVARDITEWKRADEEREELVRALQAALAEVETLRDFLPICSYCRKIRDDRNNWQTVESYIAQHTKTRFSHSICPSCYTDEVAPQLAAIERKTPAA